MSREGAGRLKGKVALITGGGRGGCQRRQVLCSAALEPGAGGGYRSAMTVPGMYHTETIEIDASTEEVYALVSDLPRMGEWSPENRGGRWLDGATGAVGDRFEGDNKIGEREWSVVCHITKAEPGSEFQFVTGDPDAPFVRWSYRLSSPAAGSGPTEVTEVWDVEQLPPTLAKLNEEQLAMRAAQVRRSMAETLIALKATAES